MYLMSQACEALLLLLTVHVQGRGSSSASQTHLRVAFKTHFAHYFLLPMSFVLAASFLSGLIIDFDAVPPCILWPA